VACVLSQALAGALQDQSRIRSLGEEPIKSISAPMAICEYRPAP
jgi:class 3 adenylate cyclase